ncbi:MAG: DUF6320 domain-containing protein [Clostridia bacterium]
MSYCVNCGVELSDNEKKCPLCGTEVYHPDRNVKKVKSEETDPPYPQYQPLTIQRVSRSSIITLITLIFLLPVLLAVICDLSINGAITWSAYVVTSIAFIYICVLLPVLSKKPDPAFCIAIDACALIFLLMFIEKRSGGHWFASFALPLAVYISAVLIALVLLGHRHVISPMKITALTFMAVGGGTLLIELLLNHAFSLRSRLIWSFYPLTVLVIIGIVLIYIDCNKALKERLAKKFFI